MTNEEAARILIKTVSRLGGAHDDVDQALQIAIYALCNATGNGIQFAERDKNTKVEEKNECPHEEYERYDVSNGYVFRCKTCGECFYEEKE